MTRVENYRHRITQEIEEFLGINLIAVVKLLRRLGVVSKVDVRVPHELTENNSIVRISDCDLLLKRNEINPFLKQSVICDKEWIEYINAELMSSWSKCAHYPWTSAKFTFEKVLLCILWDWVTCVYYELKLGNHMIISEKYWWNIK